MVKYEPGDVICENVPFVHSVAEDQKGQRCDNCMKESTYLRKCGKCGLMWYCSKECQREDWTAVHKFKECSILSKPDGKSCPALDVGQYHFMLRFLLKAELDPSAKLTQFKLYNGKTRTIDDIMHHGDQVNDCPDELNAILAFAAHLRGLGVDIKDQTVVTRCSQLFTNCFAIEGKRSDRSSFHEDIGLGLFVASAYFDHSCSPNTCRIFDGTKHQVRATKSIDTDKEDIFTSYIIVSRNRDERRQMLRDSYRFECNCSKCSTEDKFDYEKFQSMKNSVLELYGQRKFREASSTLKKVHELSKEISGAYSPLQTEMLWNCIQFTMVSIATEKDKSKSRGHLKSLVGQFKAAVKVTHGPKHSFSAHACKFLAKYEL